jgi:hypothetical protein
MGPWINPIQLASLFFLWGYYFIKKYESEKKISLLVLAGIFVGMSWAFWDAVIYFSIILGLSYLYNKKFYNFVIYGLFVLIGLSPKLLLDQAIFNSFFVGILRYMLSTVVTILWNGIYGSLVVYSHSYLNILSVLLLTPWFFYKLFTKENWKSNRPEVLALGLSYLLILFNSQVRYLIFIVPVMIYILAPKLSKKEFKIYLVISIILSILVSVPYVIQINNSTNLEEFNVALQRIGNPEIRESEIDKIQADLSEIEKDFPDERFIVGNHPDYYLQLSMWYWGEGIEEFISIQDYELYLENETILFDKFYSPKSNIENRREVFIGGGIKGIINGDENYDSVQYAISFDENLEIEGFELEKEYSKLRFFERN